MNIKLFKIKTGFTLIETLVAISIFTASVALLINVTATGISNVGFVKNKLTASYLAQEGVELVRNIRDTNALQSFVSTDVNWNTFLTEIDGCIVSSGDESCYIDPISNIVKACPLSGDCSNYLKLDQRTPQSTGLFTYANTGPYQRIIQVEKIRIDATSDQVKVRSKVKWTQGLLSKEIEYSEILFDWNSIGN